ncbi:MAG TPA: ABC transporter permease [Devosiaceae bacterium]|jgi:NitT/TauT family transport system permease protein
MTVNLLRLLVVAVLLVLWQFAAPAFNLVFFMSTPSEIGKAFWAILLDGTLLANAWTTAIETVAGFALGGIVGAATGVVLGRNKLLADVLEPFITMFYSLPKAALAPLFILWLGIGINMKIVLVSTIVFFLVFLNTFTGVRQVSREQLAITKLMGASEGQLVTKVIMPSAMIWVFTGLRLSVPNALIGAILGEIVASNRGLGYLLMRSTSQFDTPGAFAALFAILLMSLFFNIVVRISERLLMPWRTEDTGAELRV